MSDLYSQRSNYYLSLSEQRIIIKNDNKEIVKEVSISLVDNVLLFGNALATESVFSDRKLIPLLLQPKRLLQCDTFS